IFHAAADDNVAERQHSGRRTRTNDGAWTELKLIGDKSAAADGLAGAKRHLHRHAIELQFERSARLYVERSGEQQLVQPAANDVQDGIRFLGDDGAPEFDQSSTGSFAAPQNELSVGTGMDLTEEASRLFAVSRERNSVG